MGGVLGGEEEKGKDRKDHRQGEGELHLAGEGPQQGDHQQEYQQNGPAEPLQHIGPCLFNGAAHRVHRPDGGRHGGLPDLVAGGDHADQEASHQHRRGDQGGKELFPILPQKPQQEQSAQQGAQQRGDIVASAHH